MKILLLEPIYPPTAVWGSFKSARGFLPSIGLSYIYSILKHKKYDVTFVDTQFGDFNEEVLSKHLSENRYDLVGIPVYTSTASYCFHTARICKKILPNAKIVFGNIHASIMPIEVMRECPECDFIIRHEGELTILELINAIVNKEKYDRVLGLVWRQENSIIVNPPRPFIDNLDSLPLGMYSDMSLQRYIPHPTQYVILPNYPFVTQRGCPYSCIYCGASTILGKKRRTYSTDRIIQELEILKYDKKARGIYFQDSTFTINRDYTMELMNKMIKANLNLLWSCNTRTDTIDKELLRVMKAAGCRQIVFGIESGNQESLNVIKKSITLEKQTEGVRLAKSMGFRVMNNFILCLPGENEAMVRNTIFYARKLRAPVSLFYLPVPYPGTELYNLCKQENGIRTDVQWKDYLAVDFDNPIYVNPLIGKRRMKYWYKKAFFTYYINPGIWFENVKCIRSKCDIIRVIYGIKALMGSIFYNLNTKKVNKCVESLDL